MSGLIGPARTASIAMAWEIVGGDCEMRLIAVRHGETQWNLEGREQGHRDSPLTARGISQAAALARRLQRERFSALYSSDLGRALRTAEHISRAVQVPITREARLRERDLGVFEGLTQEEMAQRFPVEFAAYRRSGHQYRIPQGESGQERLERSVRVLTDIADRHPTETVVVVTHGGFLTGFFEYVLGVSPGNGWRFMRQNAAFNSFEYRQCGWCLETWNETAHLEEIGCLGEPTPR